MSMSGYGAAAAQAGAEGLAAVSDPTKPGAIVSDAIPAATAAAATAQQSGDKAATGLDPTFSSALEGLIAASNGRLRIKSGFRDIAEQTQLWDDAVKKYGSPEAARKWVAPPGHSNHNRGLAADLEGDISLAHELAPRFGLVFPMSWENWHIEPVHARDGASDQAYTDPPPGAQSPKTDQSLSTRPDFLAATLSNAMRALSDPSSQGTGIEPVSAIDAQLPGGGAAAGSSSTGAGGNAPVSVGKDGIDPSTLYTALIQKGLSPAMAAAGVAIAGRESSYSPSAYNGNRNTGDDSYGLFQINLLNGGWTDFLKAHGMSDPASALRTAQGSIDAFTWIAQSSGLNPWGGYKGANWYDGTNLEHAVAASGNAVSIDDLEGLT